jgi:hypothetical protein
MKLLKLMLMTAAGCAIVSTASAQQVFHINGSTAYRKATYAAIKAMYGSGLTTGYPKGDDSTGSGLYEANVSSGSTNLIFKGTLTNGVSTTIFCNWAGSVGGIKSVAGSLHWDAFLSPSEPAIGSAIVYDAAHPVPDMCMADNFQDVTVWTSATPGFVDSDSVQVAVVEFTFAKNTGAPADIVNVTPYQLGSLYAAGKINQAQVTGVAADATNFIFAIGRDDDSGTRIITFADTGIGTGATVKQFEINQSPYGYFSAGTASPNGNDGGGYGSGGTMAKALEFNGAGYTTNINGKVFGASAIGYLGILDANGTVPTNQWLTYDGVFESDAAIEQGEYSLWGQENLEYRDADYSGGNPNLAPFADALVIQLEAQAGTGAVSPGTLSLNSMDCTRNDDGGAISHN